MAAALPWMRAADAPGDKALVISTTLFCEADHRSDWELPMSRIIADWGLRYPGAKNVEPVYFYEVAIAEPPKPQEHRRRAYELGEEFAVASPDASAPGISAVA